ncbi:DUF4883 family protein [Clostridium sp. C2-6-12]|uniref:DUF4883 family protein n=1 Tax=Clostridium sp. C2-6-12 TaxID=2698832 RepID=UPI00136951CE|nr:DUF4883 family protein [Clostridium sp. C2-6-12]
MKKSNLIIIILLLFFTLTSCSIENPKYINFSAKPNNHYYTDQLENKILTDDNFTLYVFDTNLYKEMEVPKDENNIIKNFLSSLVLENYTDSEISNKEIYRIKIVFSNDKYLIKVFDNSTISLSPWDGNYKEDIILIKDLPLRYNLIDFCNHIANKPLSN